MAKVFVAFLYMAAILIIGFVSARKVKTAEDFATAGKQIPFWTNVYSMASAQIGAGATMGVASMTYQYGFSGMVLGLGAATGAILSGLVFAKKIREADVTTIPELIRNKLGVGVANMICILTIVQVFGILASQVRSLGTILQIFIPSMSLLTAIVIMSIVMMIYSVIGGMVAATNTDKLNVSIMILSVMVVTPIIAMMSIGGTRGMAEKLTVDQLSLTTMGLPSMASTFLYFGLVGMINNENFLRICGAKNAKEAKGATLTAALLIYLPYMIFAGLIGIMGIILIPELGTSDSIIPAMLSGLPTILIAVVVILVLSASMSTLSSLVLTSSSTLTLDFLKATIKKDMSEKRQILTIRLLVAAFIAVSVVLALVQYRSGVTFIAQLMGISWGALAGAFLAPFLYGLYWKRATTAACWACFGFSTVVMTANIFCGDRFPALLQSPINAGAFCMLAGLIIVPLVSLLTKPPRPEAVAQVFACYDRKVVVSVKDSIGDQPQYQKEETP